jgi:hypothetical protein
VFLAPLWYTFTWLRRCDSKFEGSLTPFAMLSHPRPRRGQSTHQPSASTESPIASDDEQSPSKGHSLHPHLAGSRVLTSSSSEEKQLLAGSWIAADPADEKPRPAKGKPTSVSYLLPVSKKGDGMG